jgi:probable phosphoglycerate mutase
MQQLAKQAAALLRQIPKTSFTHIPRAQNSHADRLANQAMDDQAAGLAWRPREVGGASAAGARPADTRNTRYGWSSPAGMPTVAMLLRHGETALSIEKRFSGRGDPGLTERGEAQAAAAAARLADLGVEVIVTSPLRRARQTAEAVAAKTGGDLVVDDGFAETDFGDWEGLTFGEVGKAAPDELRAWLADPDNAPPGGESMTATALRVAAARERVVEQYGERRVLIVTHVTPIKLLLRDALDGPLHTVFRVHLDPASLSIIDWRGEAPPVVRLVNDTSHLAGGLATPFGT